jgi:hypothetical protein
MVFTDECRFCIYNDAKEKCWCKLHEGYLDKCSTPSVKFGGGGIMFWGAVWVGGKSSLLRIKDTMDSELYIQMLDEDIFSELRETF